MIPWETDSTISIILTDVRDFLQCRLTLFRFKAVLQKGCFHTCGRERVSSMCESVCMYVIAVRSKSGTGR